MYDINPWIYESKRNAFTQALHAGYYPVIHSTVFICRNDLLSNHEGEGCIPAAEVALSRLFRSLWEQHVAWTRMLIISIAADLPDEAFVTKRLLRNAPEMGAVFGHYYGEDVAARFSELFTAHLVIAAELVKAAKAGNNELAAAKEKQWYANADGIAEFLSSINPNWPKQVLVEMLHEHLRLTKDEAVFRLTGQYEADIKTYDEIEKQALMMADAFTDGIVKQFMR